MRHASRTVALRAARRTAAAGAVVAVPSLVAVYAVAPRVLVAAAVGSLVPIAALCADSAARARRRLEKVIQAAAPAADEEWVDDVLRAGGMVGDPDDVAPQLVAGALHTAAVARRQATESAAELRRTSQGMAELFARRVYAEERTTVALAAELHDTVAQSLTAALWGLEHGLGVEEVAADVREAEQHLRAILAVSRTPELAVDVASAVRALCDQMSKQYGLTVAIRRWPTADIGVTPAQAATLYRFVQEALRNVVRHAGVRHAELAVSVTDGTLQAEIHDDGKGFDPTTVRPSRGRHVGLLLMNDRAQAGGGRATVTSVPGAGTTVTLSLPLDAGR